MCSHENSEKYQFCSLMCFHIGTDTINVTALLCFDAVANTEWVASTWIEMMHLSLSLSCNLVTETPSKRLQIARTVDISVCYLLPFPFVTVTKNSNAKRGRKKKTERKKAGGWNAKWGNSFAAVVPLPAGPVNGEKKLENGFCSGSFSTSHCLSKPIPLCL